MERFYIESWMIILRTKTFAMMRIEKLIQPSELSEAYEILHNEAGSTILGGCGYLRLANRRIKTAIDLSRLQLDQVAETTAGFEIGAMTSLRTLEVHPRLSTAYCGVLAACVENIVGVQLRNCVTIGGSVAGRYPFSDPLTALLALDAQLKFFHHGRVPLADYLTGKGYKDILVSILLPRDNHLAAFRSIRRSHTDYAVINTAVCRQGQTHRIVVGSRPGRATCATAAGHYLDSHGLDTTTAKEAARLAASELHFGDNPRGSGTYRKAVCPVLLERALTEVLNAA